MAKTTAARDEAIAASRFPICTYAITNPARCAIYLLAQRNDASRFEDYNSIVFSRPSFVSLRFMLSLLGLTATAGLLQGSSSPALEAGNTLLPSLSSSPSPPAIFSTRRIHGFLLRAWRGECGNGAFRRAGEGRRGRAKFPRVRRGVIITVIGVSTSDSSATRYKNSEVRPGRDHSRKIIANPDREILSLTSRFFG